MKRLARYVLFTAICVFCAVSVKLQAKAADHTVSIQADEEQSVELYVGDTGKILPIPSVSQNTEYEDWWDDEGYYVPAPVGPGYYIPAPAGPEMPVRYEFKMEGLGWNSDDPCITLDAEGNFSAIAPGTDTVKIVGYDSSGLPTYYAYIYFTVRLDMSNVSLEKTTVTGYLFADYDYGDYVYYSPVRLEIPVISPVVLDETIDGIDLSCTSSNENVSSYVSLSDNTLALELRAQEKCNTKLTIMMGGKKYKVSVKLQPVRMSDTSYLLEEGHTKQLKVKGYSGKITWSSTNPEIASVSKNGVVKGKKIGNVVITAKLGDQRVGCAVSVTAEDLKKVCARAAYIGTNWAYSQEKRTQSGYYDCSALVWKAYREYTNINFGSSSYPGTTRTESAWCRDHNKMISGGYSYKKIRKMQMNPGDIIFKSTDEKDPYNTTYHVEMFTGYICIGYDRDGKPIVDTLWAARGIGYMVEEGSMLARPTK